MSTCTLATDVKYSGFVHIETDGLRPTSYHATMAAALFDKKNMKATRYLSPLFALKCNQLVNVVVAGDHLKFTTCQNQFVLSISAAKLVLCEARDRRVYLAIEHHSGVKLIFHQLKMKTSARASSLCSRIREVHELIRSGSSDTDSDVTEDVHTRCADEDSFMTTALSLSQDQLAHFDEELGNTSSRFVSVDSDCLADSSDHAHIGRTSSASEQVLNYAPVEPTYLEPLSTTSVLHTPLNTLPAVPPRSRLSSTASALPTSCAMSLTLSSMVKRPLPQIPDAARAASVMPIGTESSYLHVSLTRQGAVSALLGKPAGTFLVRPSERNTGFALTLVLASGRIQHFKITVSAEGLLAVAGNDKRTFSSLARVIEYYHTTKLTPDEDYCLYPCAPGMAAMP